MPTNLLVNLDREWESLVLSRDTTRRLAGWQDDPCLWGFTDLRALIAHVHRRGRAAESDRVLAALARRAATDDLAARTLLQALLPGVKALARSYRWAGTREEVASMVVAAAFERIRNYPIDRRPTRIAANVIQDTRQTLCRRLSRETAATTALGPMVEVDDRVPDVVEPAASEELLDLVGEAVRIGKLSKDGARLILLNRIADKPLTVLAAAQGEDVRVLRQRRRAAEAALATAVA